jgi:hypothetical protein
MVLIKGKTAELPGQLDCCIEIAGPFRHRLAGHHLEQLQSLFLERQAATPLGKTANAEQDLSANYRAGRHASLRRLSIGAQDAILPHIPDWEPAAGDSRIHVVDVGSTPDRPESQSSFVSCAAVLLVYFSFSPHETG